MHTSAKVNVRAKQCLGRRRFTELDQSLDTNLSRSQHCITSIIIRKLTIQLLPSSVLFVIRSEKMATAASYCLAWMLLASSFICWIVSGFSRSSLLRWSNKMLSRFSVSRTCCLYCAGAFAFTRCISASSISYTGRDASGICERSPAAAAS
jgi:hypothetical protein